MENTEPSQIWRNLGNLDEKIIYELDNQKKKRLILVRNIIFREIMDQDLNSTNTVP